MTTRIDQVMTPEAKADALAVLSAATRALAGGVTSEGYETHAQALHDLVGRLERAETWGQS